MNFNTVLGKFQGYLKKGSRECFKGVLSCFQCYLKEVQREIQGSFKCISRAFVSRMFHGSFQDVSKKFQGRFTEM